MADFDFWDQQNFSFVPVYWNMITNTLYFTFSTNYFILAFHLENKHQTPFWSKVFIFINISAESEDALSQSELRERQIFHHTFCEPQTSKGLQTKWTKLDHDLMIIINNILCRWREDNAINLYEGSKLPIYYKNVLIIKS